jgi:hypothetical protein
MLKYNRHIEVEVKLHAFTLSAPDGVRVSFILQTLFPQKRFPAPTHWIGSWHSGDLDIKSYYLVCSQSLY